MGFLKLGHPLTWEDSLKHIAYIREHGITQFLETYNRVKTRSNDVLKWGDEVEYHVVVMDEKTKTVAISLHAHTLLKQLQDGEDASSATGTDSVAWHPEFGAWMIEATPGGPYGNFTSDLLLVEANMEARRKKVAKQAGANEAVFSMVAFPLMGVGTYTSPPTAPGGIHARSAYISDEVISHHPRFAALVTNIRKRRGSHVCIRVPIFRDTNTVIKSATDAAATATTTSAAASAAPTPAASAAGDAAASAVATGAGGGAGAAAGASAAGSDDSKPCGPASDDTDGFVHMDAMAFGMGCCCLQVTFQARDLAESRRLYDHLAVLSPVVMALTAASAVFKGRLVDVDARWNVICESVDCRTPIERGVSTEKLDWQKTDAAKSTAGAGGTTRIYKSRYDSIDCYINDGPKFQAKYNDIDLVCDKATLDTLVKNGVDEQLARHVAHLYARDPLVIIEGSISEVDDTKSTEHFENIQSTNWQNVRWKPPPPDAKDMGWRVELRTMEAQLTDFENAAFTVFAALASRVILFFDLNLYIPMSKVDENMKRAQLRNAVLEQKFYFRKFVTPLPDKCPPGIDPSEDPDAYEEMTIQEIISGKGAHFPGLAPLISTYMELIGCTPEEVITVSDYMRFIEMRASGEVMTAAAWQREFIRGHPAYKKDSVVTQEIAYDLLTEIKAIAEGKHDAKLFGPFRKKSSATLPSPPKGKRLRGSSFSSSVGKHECFVIKQLVERYSVMSSFQNTPAFIPTMAGADAGPNAAADATAAVGGAGGGAGAGSS